MVEKIKDFEFDKIKSFDDLINQFEVTGFQATNLNKAVSLIKEMKKEKALVFLSFTSNMVASGLRGAVKYLCENKLVDVIITASGSIDHDIIKSKVPYLQGSFSLDDNELHKKGLNRIGNILVPNDGYIFLEKFFQSLLKKNFEKQKTFSPSELIDLIGAELTDDSFLYHCHKNKIPVFCPGITDGAIGLNMLFFKQENPDFKIDVTKDLTILNNIVLNAEKTGGIVLGGGISKHHLIAANILRDGLDYAVYVSTSNELDGSLSGATPKEAKSWGKLKEEGSSVHVFGEATITVPLIIMALKEKNK